MDWLLTEEDYIQDDDDVDDRGLPSDDDDLPIRGRKQSKKKQMRDEASGSDAGSNDEYDDDDDDLVVGGDDNGLVGGIDGVIDGVEVAAADNDAGGADFEGFVGSDDEAKESKPKKEPKRRRVSQHPRVFLNVDRLKHANALAALPGLMKTIKWKGKGHEEEDLNTVMLTMERWAHIVMPNMKFDDFIEKTEQLGSKKLIKTFVNKIRYDMPLDIKGQKIEDDDEIKSDDDDMIFDDLPPIPAVNADEAFNKMMEQAKKDVEKAAQQKEQSVSGNQPAQEPPKQTSSLTEEQRRRIAENARKAAERRLQLAQERAKQQEAQQNASNASKPTDPTAILE